MNKNRIQVLCIIILALVLVNIIFFNLPVSRTNVFWWSYGFTTSAFIIQLFIWNRFFVDIDTSKERFLYLPMLSVSTIYLIAQLTATWRLLILPNIQEWIVIITYSIILIIAIICMLSSSIGYKEVNRVDKKIAKSLNYFKMLQSDIEILIQKEQDTNTKLLLQELYEKIRYSDPISNISLLDLETEIKNKIAEITNSNDKPALIATIKNMVDERNIKLKNLK